MKQRSALSSYLSILVILVCLLVFVGWQSDITALRSLVPGFPVTTPLTALFLLTLGVALFLSNIALEERRLAAGLLCGVLVFRDSR